MSLALIYSRANLGMDAPLVTIEVHLSKGLPGLCIVGLPEKAVKESKDRVRSAIINNGFQFPVQRIVINLAPADLPKEGGRFDLPIALGILAASDQIPKTNLNNYEFVGELALTGALNPVKGVLPMALAAKKLNHSLFLPQANATEAALASDLTIFAAQHLREVCAHLNSQELIKKFEAKSCSVTQLQPYPDLADVRGQVHAKRALEIAAAGAHSILFSGSPGTGKTMLSSRLPGILPSMTDSESQSTAVVYSVSTRGFDATLWQRRPFRAPHHTASSVALVGGGSPPKPGEISLAHNGVLFLDELPEFDRHVLEALREPLEAGVVTISRAGHQALFPSRFQFIGAMNPCPCGYAGDPSGRCKCSAETVTKYQNKLSGPLLDRIDMHVTVPPLPPTLLLNQTKEKAESSGVVKERVLKAREKQMQRAQCTNAQLSSENVMKYCPVAEKDHQFLENAMTKLGLSARAYHRILKLSRTIADLEESDHISQLHLQEALGYRRQIIAVKPQWG
ncbi:MAG: YifB family Mg chelatase-like AAA ATPase [Gammaproteobacteria bacterium]|nr:YifB family Mg chelatase-like AAA ATPase [Gammaproteobacteria bacterium]